MRRTPVRLLLVVVGLVVAVTGCAGEPAPSAGGDHAVVGEPCDAAYVRVRMTGLERSTDLQLLNPELAPGAMITADGQSGDPSFSPDGHRLAFVSGAGYGHTSEHGNERQSVYVMDLRTGEVRRLTHDQQDAGPSWSPDGTRLAFIRRLPPEYERHIVVVEVATGEELTLGAGPEWRQVTWRTDEDLLVVSWRDDGSSDLLSLSAEGGAPTPVGLLPDQGAVWNPDRTAAAVTRYGEAAVGAASTRTVGVFDVATGNVHDVPNSTTQLAIPLVWTADDYLLFTQNVRGPEFNIASARGGTERATVLSEGWEKPYDAPQTANPGCALQD